MVAAGSSLSRLALSGAPPHVGSIGLEVGPLPFFVSKAETSIPHVHLNCIGVDVCICEYMHKGCGLKPMVPCWGRCITQFSLYFSGDWDIDWGYDLDFDPWPYVYVLCMWQPSLKF